MEKVGELKLYTLEEVKDELLGKVGTAERDEHEAKVAEAIQAYKIGETIREARLRQSLTQEQLGERIGVKKAQISRLERGGSISIPTIARVFGALGIPVSLNFVGLRNISLC